jgi:hypothetical protein
MKYLHEEKFIVNSNDNEGRKKYLENYDRIFGESEPCRKRPGTDDIVHTDDCDGIECKLKLYANLIVPLEAQIGPVEKVCKDCSADGELSCLCPDAEPISLPRMSDEAENQHD